MFIARAVETAAASMPLETYGPTADKDDICEQQFYSLYTVYY
jgi:hypothetical protein